MNNEDQQEPLPDRLDRFENEFKAGKTPKLENYVSANSEILELIEFIHIDMEQRFKIGLNDLFSATTSPYISIDAPNELTHFQNVKTYIAKFPGLQKYPDQILELLKREIYWLSKKGINPGLKYFESTYPDLAKDLRVFFRKEGYSLPEILGFSILEKIGQGGMGEVYKARQISLSRDVAIKIIRYDRISDLENAVEYRNKFRKEGQTLASINHSNVVKIYDAGQHEENLYLVMEHLEGESLQIKIQKQGYLTPNSSAELIEKISLGLSEVHKKGIIHRDLKPDNIFLTSVGEPKVLDFGLARHIESVDGKTKEWSFRGTPQYSSPEQSSKDGKEISVQTDVYGLGAILYACLTGSAPFPKGEDVFEILRMVLHMEVVPVLQLRPNCPKDLETICLKCLRKDPKQRYSSALELAEDLRRFQSGMPIMARPVGAIEKLSKWVKRNTAVSAAISVAVITLISGTIISSLSAIYAKEQAKLAKESEAIAVLRTEEIKEKNKLLEIKTEEINRKNQSLEMSEKKSKENEQEANNQKNKAIDQKNKLEQQVYINKIQRGHFELSESGNLTLFKSYMDSIPFFQREWEHNFLSTQLRYNHVVLNENPLDFSSAKYSLDGKYVVSLERNGSVVYWDVATGQRTRQFQIPEANLSLFFSFRYDGKRILTSSTKNRVNVSDTETGKSLVQLTGHSDWISSACYSPDGKRIVTGSSDDTGRIWDAETGNEINRLQQPMDYNHRLLHCVSYSPDGRWVAGSSSNYGILVWDSQTGQVKKIIKGHEHEVRHVSFSPDGKTLVSASADKTVRLWNFNTGKELHVLRGHKHEVDKAVFSPDGSLVATGGKDKIIKIWDSNNGEILNTFIGHEENISNLDFSPDGKKLLSVGCDKLIKIWCLEPDEVVPKKIPLNFVNLSFDFFADSKSIVVDSGGKLKKIQLDTGDEKIFSNNHGNDILCISCCPNDKFIASASADKTVKIWEAKSGKEFKTLPNHTDQVNCVSFSPDGKKMVSASSDKTVKIWSTVDWKLIHSLDHHKEMVLSAQFSSNGKRLVTSGLSGMIYILDAETGEVLSNWMTYSGYGGSVMFSKDDKYLISPSDDNKIKIWDSNSGKLIATLLGHTGSVFSVDLSPDGKRLISGSFDGSIKVWDIQNKNIIVNFDKHKNQVRCVRFSKDGNKVASLSKDGFLMIWDAAVPSEISTTTSDRFPLVAASFGNNSKIFCKDSSGSNLVWDPKALNNFETENKNLYPSNETRVTADKKWVLELHEFKINLINNSLRENQLSKDKVKLASWAKPDSNWHKKQADTAEKNGFWFSAAFHLKKLKEIDPNVFKEDKRLQNILSKLKE